MSFARAASSPSPLCSSILPLPLRLRPPTRLKPPAPNPTASLPSHWTERTHLRHTTPNNGSFTRKSFNLSTKVQKAAVAVAATGGSNSALTASAPPPTPRKKHIREDYLVTKVSAKEVQELVKGERSVPLIVDFYATWCGPCILMAQELEMLAVEYESNALFVKVDTDDEYEFARDMQVRGLPTLYFFSPDPSKDAIRTEGLVPPEMIKNIIDNEM